MAQIDDLNTALAAIQADVTTVGTDVTTLEQQLAAAQANTGADLSGPIATAQAIKASLDAIVASVPAPAEPAAPVSGDGGASAAPSA